MVNLISKKFVFSESFQLQKLIMPHAYSINKFPGSKLIMFPFKQICNSTELLFP
jgi:hypothetical protein